MALSTHEQFLAALERARRPLIALPEHATVDDFASAFGVAALLSKMQKPIDIVTSGGNIPKSLNFLHIPFSVRGDLPNIRELTLSINAKTAKIDELSYDYSEDEIKIHLLPKQGFWTAEDVRITTESYRYDLIIAIGGSDLESFGKIYKDYTDFFFQTPIINIDHDPGNEHFGRLNLVDINAVATSEVCHTLFTAIDPGLVDEEVATFFLTGMTAKTNSFRSENVTPKTLRVAGDLIARGARRDDIVENLYKTRTVETLRLWGRALARLKSDVKHNLVWTLLTKQDFVNAGTDDTSLENIIEELMISAPSAKVAVIFYEHKDGYIAAKLHAQRPFDAIYLGAPFRASGTREEAHLHLKENDIVRAEKAVIGHIQEHIERMG